MTRVALIIAISLISTSTMAVAASHDNSQFGSGVAQTSAGVSAQGSGWTGFYVGGQFGSVDLDTTVPLSDFFSDDQIVGAGFELDDTVEVGIDGTAFGLHVGYMADLGSYVLGAELDYDSIDFDELSGTFEGTTFTQSIDDNSDDTIARLKLRAGYDAGQFLPYLTVGTARLDVEDESTNGTFYGAGIAFLATNNLVIGGEILQHQFDDAFDTGFDFEARTMSLRASYKF
ncbi:MAG: outer membrane immunogenic protein [Candidatus Azotimanducaceae bacterium]|jgi:outer membrane immunogenic protein